MLYNERFFFTEMKAMQSNLVEALRKGLPYPIITVIEYMSVDKAGFLWGRGYRLAGYYTNMLLWLSFSLWIAQLFVLCLLPRYFSRALVLVGATLLLTDAVYMLSCPKNLAVPFLGLDGTHSKLEFKFGWCFWLILAAGTQLTYSHFDAFKMNFYDEYQTDMYTGNLRLRNNLIAGILTIKSLKRLLMIEHYRDQFIKYNWFSGTKRLMAKFAVSMLMDPD
ncbi:unnamed protein product [Soboliphyme baturini]|uniref:DUOXA-like protein C06E1.3 n=1 Tax=Soboliphyme baturini TaxID=241478 RepID=A0A183I9J0_9BILA|nr:unnamed protein product [Soboliphyme baturini]